MKIVDRTPFKGREGQISAVDRVRAMARYGSSWYSDVQAQDATAALLGRQLDRAYTLWVNPPLPGTDVLLPLVLIGPPGVYLINITNERGVFHAQGEEWGTLTGECFTPAKINLLTRTARLAQALQKFLESQGFTLVVEPVFMAMNPGMHIDSVRPVVRVVMSDAVERFALGVAQATRALTAESIAVINERIQRPRSPQKAAPAPVPGAAETAEAREAPAYMPQGYGEGATASGQAQPGEPAPFDADSLGFAFEDEAKPQAAQPKSPQAGRAKKPAKRTPARSGGVSFSRTQWIALGALFLIFVLLLAAIIVLAVMNA